jgi:hypothetical protein
VTRSCSTMRSETLNSSIRSARRPRRLLHLLLRPRLVHRTISRLLRTRLLRLLCTHTRQRLIRARLLHLLCTRTRRRLLRTCLRHLLRTLRSLLRTLRRLLRCLLRPSRRLLCTPRRHLTVVILHRGHHMMTTVEKLVHPKAILHHVRRMMVATIIGHPAILVWERNENE